MDAISFIQKIQEKFVIPLVWDLLLMDVNEYFCYMFTK